MKTKSQVNTELIINFIEENRLNKTTFCRQCKIGIDTFNKITNEQSNFNIIALFKIARGMGIQIKDLFLTN